MSVGVPSALRPAVVVLTPVRNEAWILDRFLAVCSTFADLIVLADQRSDDGSREIAARWPKVRLVENDSAVFNEAERQTLLIEAARRFVPGPRVLLTLDADEIVAADAAGSPEWERFLRAAPGTVLMLEKADLLPGTGECLRYAERFPYGYVDDGAEHRPRWIHSYRVPVRPESPRFEPEGIWLLHYAFVRPKAQRIKMCLYAVIENLRGPGSTRLRPVLVRRRNYGPSKDWLALGRREASDPAWFGGWEARGIDLRGVADGDEVWQAWACLRAMAEHGERRFWGEAIWDIDWERLRRAGIAAGVAGLPARPVRVPPAPLRAAWRAADRLVGWIKWRRAA